MKNLGLELESALRSSLMSEGNRKACIRAVNSHDELVEALKTAYQFFNTEANTPDKDGYTVAPDSIVRVVLRKMNQAIAKAEGK